MRPDFLKSRSWISGAKRICSTRRRSDGTRANMEFSHCLWRDASESGTKRLYRGWSGRPLPRAPQASPRSRRRWRAWRERCGQRTTTPTAPASMDIPDLWVHALDGLLKRRST
jgi:hypothetical protein